MKKRSKRIRLCLVVTMMLLTVSSLPVQGATTFSVRPGSLSVSVPLTPGHAYLLPAFILTNGSGGPLTVHADLVQHPDPQKVHPAADWFEMAPMAFTLKACFSQKVTVQMHLPLEAAAGDYKVWFRFHAVPAAAQGIVPAVALEPSLAFTVAEAPGVCPDQGWCLQR